MESALLGSRRAVVPGDFYSLVCRPTPPRQREWTPCWSVVSLDAALISNCGDCTGFELSLYLAYAGRRARSIIPRRPRASDNERYSDVYRGARDSRAAYSNCIFDRRCFPWSYCGRRNHNSSDHRANRVATYAVTRDPMRWRALVHAAHLHRGCAGPRWDRCADRARKRCAPGALHADLRHRCGQLGCLAGESSVHSPC